jgi:predicted nucleic acid-binding Zn ribbon protein
MKKEATKVTCSSCGTDKNVKRTQNFMFIFGGVLFTLAIYGLVSLIYDIKSLF